MLETSKIEIDEVYTDKKEEVIDIILICDTYVETAVSVQ